jgi:hypothetical protein
MDQRLLDRIVDLTYSNPNFPRILNRDLRPVIQRACISSPNGRASNVFISGIPYALDADRPFTAPVYAVFSRGQRGLPIPLVIYRRLSMSFSLKTKHCKAISEIDSIPFDKSPLFQ